MTHEITIIIPCYNEAERFDFALFEQYYKVLPSVYFVLVNDGSTDHTEELLKELAFAKANIHLLTLAHNVGKGEAIRQGILWALTHTKALFFAYFDADFATPLTEIKTLYQPFETNGDVQFVLGFRRKNKGTIVKRHWYRHYPGRFFALIVNFLVLKKSLYDTQCGAKLMSRLCAERHCQIPFSTRWLFDIELIKRISNDYPKNELEKHIIEIPISRWTDYGGSKIRFIDWLVSPFQLLRLALKK